MRRREINIFGVSFLDLISGALGALIIMFVVVNKEEKDVLSQDYEEKANKAAQSFDLNYANAKNKIDSMIAKYKNIEGELARIGLDIDNMKTYKDNLFDEYVKLNTQFKSEKNKSKQLENDMAVLSNEKNEFAKKNEDLNEKNNKLQGIIYERSFISLNVTWYDKSDIDIWVYHFDDASKVENHDIYHSPRWFFDTNYHPKDEKFKDHKFVKDGREGPAVENWHAEKLVKGYYVFYIDRIRHDEKTLHQDYNNYSTKVSIDLFTSLGYKQSEILFDIGTYSRLVEIRKIFPENKSVVEDSSVRHLFKRVFIIEVGDNGEILSIKSEKPLEAAASGDGK